MSQLAMNKLAGPILTSWPMWSVYVPNPSFVWWIILFYHPILTSRKTKVCLWWTGGFLIVCLWYFVNFKTWVARLTCSRSWFSICCWIRNLLSNSGQVTRGDTEGGRERNTEAAGLQEGVANGLDGRHVVPREPGLFCDAS